MIKTHENDRKRIVGIGSALIDILAYADDAFLETCRAPKGGMTLVDNAFIEKTLERIVDKPRIVPGGSACNTTIGIGNLGGSAGFVGKRGEDRFGDLFESDLNQNHVDAVLFRSKLPTGRVLTLITPDAQRTMFTYLGASAETGPEEITASCFEGAAVVHIEGYLLFNRDLILAALKTAKAAGARVSLDLSSYTVVQSAMDFLDSAVFEYVDILIANEDEAFAYSGVSDEIGALKCLSDQAGIAVVKVGKRGSYISNAGRIIRVAPKGTGQAVDTTGAGDLWASGFLYGLVNGYPLAACGELASICGFEVCQVVGAGIPPEGWSRIKQFMQTKSWR